VTGGLWCGVVPPFRILDPALRRAEAMLLAEIGGALPDERRAGERLNARLAAFHRTARAPRRPPRLCRPPRPPHPRMTRPVTGRMITRTPAPQLQDRRDREGPGPADGA
jgi:hypothetical protein